MDARSYDTSHKLALFMVAKNFMPFETPITKGSPKSRELGTPGCQYLMGVHICMTAVRRYTNTRITLTQLGLSQSQLYVQIF